MSDCLFCKIVAGDPGDDRLRRRSAFAFKDINPQAPLHVLVIPRAHRDAERSRAADDALVGDDGAARGGDRRRAAATPSAATGRSSTATPRRARRCSTSTCTCSAAAPDWPPGWTAELNARLHRAIRLGLVARDSSADVTRQQSSGPRPARAKEEIDGAVAAGEIVLEDRARRSRHSSASAGSLAAASR